MPNNFIQSYVNKSRYEWNSVDVGSGVKIVVYYSSGGMDYFTYKDMPRGVYININDVERSQGPHYDTEKYTPSRGFTVFAKSLNRLSQKELGKVMEMLHPHCEEIAELWMAGEKVNAIDKIKAVLLGGLVK